MAVSVPAALELQQPQYQTAELLISAALRGFRVQEVPTLMRDRPPCATPTKKGSNFFYGIHFAGVVFGTWAREVRRRR